MTRAHLARFCENQRGWEGNAESQLRQFFSGWPSSKKIGRFTPGLLRFVLLGGPDETSVPPDLPQDALDEADRIVRALFANCPYVENPEDVAPINAHDLRPDGVWYFWPFAQKQSDSLHIRHPFTSIEALIEMEWLRGEVADGRATDACMTRIFAEIPFRMVDMSKRLDDDRPRLTTAGNEAIECLRAGIDQVFVFPAKSAYSSKPEESANAFRLWAQEHQQSESWPTQAGRVCLVKIDCDAVAHSRLARRNRYGWEHLVPHQNITYYKWKPKPFLTNSEERLSYLRHPRHGPCTFEPDDKERAEFRDWFDLFVLPRLDATDAPPVTSKAPRAVEVKPAKRRRG